MNNSNEEKAEFDEWAIIEIMGHQRIAGRISIAPIGGGALVRVDVPETEAGPSFTKMYGHSAIYAITIATEETARAAAAALSPRPFERFDLSQMTNQLPAHTEDAEEDGIAPW